MVKEEKISDEERRVYAKLYKRFEVALEEYDNYLTSCSELVDYIYKNKK